MTNMSLDGIEYAFLSRAGANPHAKENPMSKFPTLRRLNRFVPMGLMALAAAVLLGPTPANATPLVLSMMQQGGNVVITGSGAFDLTGLTRVCSACGGTGFETIKPSTAWFNIGRATIFGNALDRYTGPITGPASYGSGSTYEAASYASGSTIMFDGSGKNYGVPYLWVPTGYLSGDPLTNTTTWIGASFASLGVKQGTYVWKWGSGTGDQTFTLVIGNGINSVSEPTEFGMFGLGLLLIGGFVGLRRRVVDRFQDRLMQTTPQWGCLLLRRN